MKDNGKSERLGAKGEQPVDKFAEKSAEKPVSLHPLGFEEAVKGLLRTKPVGEKASKDDA